MRQLQTQFTFAGFNFPRYIPEFSRSKYDKRTFRAVYYHAPAPLTGKHSGKGFYLGDTGSFNRWIWCDQADGVSRSIQHKGWYCDNFQYQTIRGIVVRLPHNRFLAGWSMGEGMASCVDGDIYDDERSAALAADSLAERAAEDEREYREIEEEKCLEEDSRLDECQGGDEEETLGY